MDSYIGQIRMTASPLYLTRTSPDWMLCKGQILAINDYPALYAVIGTTYGGNGSTNFALPNLNGQLPIGSGTTQGGTPRQLGQQVGTATAGLVASQLPVHTHAVNASTATATSTLPGPTVMLATTAPAIRIYTTPPAEPPPNPPQALAPQSVASTGLSGAEHSNMMPTTGVVYYIFVNGIFPST